MTSSRGPALPLRLVAAGTRVVVLKGPAPHVTGVVREVRLEPHLRTYVVTCDDGTTVYASGYDLAHEGDLGITPLAPRPAD
ncbi:MAG TPA: hypothetical protein VKE22_02240 [Haliangiales bacterium]|nr:hypothetical protein [Haliangiales bacterium]